MNIQDCYELEVLVVGNILNDRNNLKHIAVEPDYFFDQSCRKIVEYVIANKSYNLYDMCVDLDINFELCTELATNLIDKKSFQHRVIKLRDHAILRQRIMDEIDAAHSALISGIDPISVGSILSTNIGNILEQGSV